MSSCQLMSCPSETDLRRWAEALAPPAAAAGETLYAGWDCPQVAALYAYAPRQPDELALAQGDVVNVTRKTSEGGSWFFLLMSMKYGTSFCLFFIENFFIFILRSYFLACLFDKGF